MKRLVAIAIALLLALLVVQIVARRTTAIDKHHHSGYVTGVEDGRRWYVRYTDGCRVIPGFF